MTITITTTHFKQSKHIIPGVTYHLYSWQCISYKYSICTRTRKYVRFSSLLVKVGQQCLLYISATISYWCWSCAGTIHWSIIRTARIHSSSKDSPWISHKLYRTQQAATSFGKSRISISFHLSKHLQRPLSLPYACSTTTLALLNL